jgi:hypothetical protein
VAGTFEPGNSRVIAACTADLSVGSSRWGAC